MAGSYLSYYGKMKLFKIGRICVDSDLYKALPNDNRTIK